MATHYVANVSDIREGGSLIVEVEGRSIGIYRLRDRFYALHNRCPHEGAPLCKGPVCGTTLPSRVHEYVYGREGEIVRCPWHGWEFEIETGRALVDGKIRVRTYPVEVKDGRIGIVIGSASPTA